MNGRQTDTTIKYYRRKLNIRQSDLANKLGLTNTDMSFIENKKLYPKPDKAEKLAEFLEVPIGKLYSEKELELITFRNRENEPRNN